MKFLEILSELKNEYKDNCIVRKNGTILLGPNTIPKCRHMLFRSLEEKYIQEHLVLQYENEFPQEYIDFLTYSNGVDLYMIKMKAGKKEFASSLLTVYGLPYTKPFGRPLDMEEPFDLRVEDLARHKNISDQWLKCGSFKRKPESGERTDIFIDTITHKVFACVRNQEQIIRKWDSLDECFCTLYNSFVDTALEYEYHSKF